MGLLLATVALLASGACSWSTTPSRGLGRTAGLTKMNAFGALARKAKEAEAAKLRKTIDADDTNPIGVAMRAAEEGDLPARKNFGNVASSLKKMRGTLAIVAEYHRRCPAALKANGVEEYEIPEINFVSSEVRAAGASVFALNVDPRSGGCTEEDFFAAQREQATAAGDFPGPLPLVWSDTIVDEVQLAAAYVAGAEGVTLPLETLGAEKCKALNDAARDKYGLEAMILCQPRDDDSRSEGLAKLLKIAQEEVEAKIIVVGGVDAATAIEAHPLITDKAIVTVARVQTRDNKGLDEAEDAWKLRDAGYNAVWAADVLYKFGSFSGTLFEGSADSITSVIKAMKSKASTQYARASGSFSGRGEGAKEYLGDIMM